MNDICISESYLKMEELDLREAIRDVCNNSYNTDEVICELNCMVEELDRNEVEMPQYDIELQDLGELNQHALSRAISISQSWTSLLQVRKVSSSVDPPAITDDNIKPCLVHGVIPALSQ